MNHHVQPRSLSERRATVIEQLRSPGNLWLATASDGRGPHLIPVSYWWDEARLTTATFANSRTIDNVRSQPKVRASVGTPTDVVMIDAIATVVATADINTAAAEGYAQVSGNDPRSDASFIYLQLTPQRMQAWRNPAEFTGRTIMRGGTWLTTPID